MAKRVKIETAGQLVRMSCYTMQLPQDSGKARAEKAKLSSEARSRMNARTSWNKCRLTMAANFEIGDLFVTLTYADQNLPDERADALKLLQRWLDRMREEYKRSGNTLRYIYTTENAHGDGRYHHHIVMNRIDNARDLFRSKWPFGSVDVEYIDNIDYAPLAKYFTKEGNDKGRKVGQRTWTPSRGLRKPKTETIFVPDNFTLSTPPGCTMLANPSGRNAYGEFSYLEYITPTKQQKKDAEGAKMWGLHMETS